MPELRAMTTADLFTLLFPAILAGLALTAACAGIGGDGDSIIPDSGSSDDTDDDHPDTETGSDGDDDSDGDTDTETDTDTEPVYPGGHYQLVEANPLKDNFLETFRIGDFAGKHAFWFVFCPL